LSNFEPLTAPDVQKMVDQVVDFDQFSDPVKKLLNSFLENRPTQFVVSSSQPRIVDGAPSKNPRYLQYRPDLANPRDRHLAEMGTRLAREIAPADRVHFPVNAVLAGR